MAVVLFNPNGSLDAGFGMDGVVTVDFGGDEHAGNVIIQPDGKLILGGSTGDWWSSHFTLARLTVDGKLDRSFGHGTGKVITDSSDFGYGSAWLSKIALEPDGRIVAAGTTSAGDGSDFIVVRYLPNGGLDPTFGDRGIVTTNFGAYQYEDCADKAIQPDGKIVVVGRTNFTATGSDFALARYEAGPMYAQATDQWYAYLASIDWLSAVATLADDKK